LRAEKLVTLGQDRLGCGGAVGRLVLAWLAPRQDQATDFHLYEPGV
jgi:hypothetical protein